MGGGRVVEDVAREVFERLSRERDGTILAVWKDGEITVEDFGFRGRRTAAGRIEPIVTFPAKAPLTYYDVEQRLTAALQRRGLLPVEAEPAGQSDA